VIVLVAICYRSRYDKRVNIYIYLLVRFHDIMFIYMDNVALCLLFFFNGSTAVVGLDLLYEVPRSHSFRHSTLGWTFWASDLPATATSF